MKACPGSSNHSVWSIRARASPTRFRATNAPSSPLRGEGLPGERGRGTTHRGSISTGHSWETWFPQRTLIQTREHVREGTPLMFTPSLGCPGLQNNSDIVTQDACCGPCSQHPVLPAPKEVPPLPESSVLLWEHLPIFLLPCIS